MSVSSEYSEYILELLGDFEVETKKMFGGILMKVDGQQLGIIRGDNRVFFKVTDLDLQKKFKSEGSKQFSYTRKDKKEPVIIKNWWEVPERYMDSKEEFTSLTGEILDQK